MDARAFRGNRIGLGLTGIVLIGAGAETLARGFGGYGHAAADRPLPGDAIADYLAEGWVNQLAAAGPGIAVALLGLGWLLVQTYVIVVRTRRLRPERDSNVRFARAVVDALAADVGDYPGVRRARCRLLGTSRHPWLSVTIGCADHADPPALRSRLDDDVRNVREMLGIPRLPVVIRFRVLAAGPAKEREEPEESEDVAASASVPSPRLPDADDRLSGQTWPGDSTWSGDSTWPGDSSWPGGSVWPDGEAR